MEERKEGRKEGKKEGRKGEREKKRRKETIYCYFTIASRAFSHVSMFLLYSLSMLSQVVIRIRLEIRRKKIFVCTHINESTPQIPIFV